MDLSVLIPTHQRPRAIECCLHRLAAEWCVGRFEVIIGLDGEEYETSVPTLPKLLEDRTTLVRPGRVGLLRLRRAMMQHASGRIVLWLNDDSYPNAGLLDAHLQTHDSSSVPRVVAGRSVWAPVDHPTLFDRLVQCSDMVFFGQPDAGSILPTDYRNCFGLNMSFPRDLSHEVGGVALVDERYGYEDIELAWRMVQAGAECVYQPKATVEHDHRYRPSEVHRREYLLGRAAHSFATVNPAFATELFRCDLREQAFLEHLMHAIELGWRDALRIERSFLSLDDHASDAVDDGVLPILAEHWVLLKRLLWRWGVLDAQRGIPMRWSILQETSCESVLCASPDPV